MGFFTSDHARRDGRVTVVQLLSALLMFVAFSVIGGFLIAGIVLPAATVAGAAASGTSDLFEELPAELEDVRLPQQSNIYASDGKTLLATFFVENRVVVPLEEISPWMQQAIVAIEDRRFWDHHGVDGEGLVSAAVKNVTSDASPGASTLTQQLVKNTLLQEAQSNDDNDAIAAATEVSISRKIREWRLALAFEENLDKELGTQCTTAPEVDCGKKEILQQYLNIAQFGSSRLYGVEAAAQYYFSKPASKLSVIEAATIAGITQNPSKWDPTRTFGEENNYANAETRRDTVLGAMMEQGMITEEEFNEYEAIPVEATLDVSRPQFSCAASSTAPFFCDYVTKVISRHEIFNTDEQSGEDLLYRGGLDIVTTLDVKKQKIANEELRETLPEDDPSGFAMAMVALDPDTGEILAMAQNREFDPAAEVANSTSINYAVDRDWGGSRGFSPGSTFKPVILAEWLNSGHSLRQIVSGSIREWNQDNWRETCNGPVLIGQEWEPTNVLGTSAGQMTVLDATANSVNTSYVSMASQLDLCDIEKMAENLGFHRADGQPFEQVPSATLGTQNSSPLTMASVMQTFANEGVHCEPIAIKSITRPDGSSIDVPPVDCRQAISAEVAAGVTYAMEEVMHSGSGRNIPLDDGRPSAGKTGTSQKNAHTWFAGYTPQLVSVFWLGHPDQDVPQQNITLNGTPYKYVYGSTLAAPTWQQFMNRALEGEEILELPAVSDEILNGVPVRVPDVRGRSETSARIMANDAGFLYSVSEQLIFSDQFEPGTIAAQSPSAGSTMTPGSTMTVYVATDTYPDWWFNWPADWDRNVAPDDYWGSTWPPAEFESNPPNGWVVEPPQCEGDDVWNENKNEPCPGFEPGPDQDWGDWEQWNPDNGGNGDGNNGNGNGNGRNEDD